MEGQTTLCHTDPSQEPPWAPAHLPVGIPGDLNWDRGHGDGQAAWLRTSISSRPHERLRSKVRNCGVVLGWRSAGAEKQED